ncbi:MAG: Phosphinothricin N-acetyltransferase [Pseudomonadota bacterium]|jgi:phosphinothricin acetyltransferase
MIRHANSSDAAQICAIYNWYIENTFITFEEVPLSTEQMAARIAAAGSLRPWLVFESAGRIQGYAYAGEWKSRAAYRYAVETTIYLDKDCHRGGLGRQLYISLIERLRETPVHALIAGIALPNTASVGLHEAMGFAKVAHFREVGFKFNQWIDVGYWQLNLESAIPAAGLSQQGDMT